MFSFKRKLKVSSDQLNSLYVKYDEKRFNVYNDFVKANQKNCKSSAIFLITGKTILVELSRWSVGLRAEVLRRHEFD